MVQKIKDMGADLKEFKTKLQTANQNLLKEKTRCKVLDKESKGKNTRLAKQTEKIYELEKKLKALKQTSTEELQNQ